MRMTLEELLRQGEEILKAAGIEEAALDAWYLLEYICHMDKVYYLLHKKEIIEEKLQAAYEDVIRKRAERIPLQHITHEQEFMGYSFYVNENVLIPRQDTEILVERILSDQKRNAERESISVLDVCTGSGCIIISLAKEMPLKKAAAVDISKEALEVAKKNCEQLDVLVELKQSDLFEAVTEQYDVIVSNPPYIESREIEELMPEVKNHEPLLALDGKEDGLYFYRKIIEESTKYLKDNGSLYFEIGYNQGAAVKQMMDDAGFLDVKVEKDLAGLDRIVFGRFSMKNP